MKFGKKELAIIIPLVALAILITVSFVMKEEDVFITETECQEGWFKYESGSGTLCSKTELNQRQIDEYGK